MKSTGVAMPARRAVVKSLCLTALASAMPALAQSRRLRVAWLSFVGASDGSTFLDELRQGLRQRGYIEGENLTLDAFWADDSQDRLTEAVSRMIASAPDIIVSQGVAVNSVKRATSSIPVVFGYSGDPVEAGFVSSFAHPGGNMTGISYLTIELVGKRLEILREAMPGLRRVAILAAPQHPGDKVERRASASAASTLGIATTYFEARDSTELTTAMSAMEKSGCDAVVMFPVQYVISQRERIAAWAVRNRLPTISGWAQFADGGNFMSYGPNLHDCSARMAFFVDRIAKGVHPADIPVELPTRVEFVINLKAAKALGVTVPPTLAVRADRVIS